MKISKLLIITLLATCSLMTVSSAKAATTKPATQTSGLFGGLTTWLNGLLGGSSSSGSSTSGTKGGTTGTSLPIDNNVWFLIIAAGVVGCKVIMNKSKETSVQISEL